MSSINTRLEQVRKSYVNSLVDKAGRIRELWDNIKSARFAEATAKAQEELFTIVHSIGGSGATFGFEELTDTAKPLETLLKQLANNPQPSRDHIAQINTLVSALVEICYSLAGRVDQHNTVELLSDDTSPTQAVNKQIYILESDRPMAEGLFEDMAKKDYQARIFSNIDELVAALAQDRPLALLIDCEQLHRQKLVLNIAAQREQHGYFSVICTAASDNMTLRLESMRAGTDYFLARPVDPGRLLNILDSLSTPEQEDPYRVLIIDDDEILASLYAGFLERVGITVRIIADPREALEHIRNFTPELILLDIHMQYINGFEITRLIRQIPEFDMISIIFMSSEQDIQQQLAAIDHVGDLLKKPVLPEHLTTMAISKCRHARKLIQTQNKLQDTLRKYEAQKLAIDQHSIISITDAQGSITYVNHMFSDISGYSEAELIGKNHRIIKSNEHDNHFYTQLWQTISSGKIWQGEIKNRAKNGDYYWVESTIMPFLDNNGIPYQYISIRTDITKIKNAELQQKQRQQRLQEQNTSLSILTNKEKLFLEDKTTAYQKICELVAETLHVERAGIWFFNDSKDKLSCANLYDISNNALETTQLDSSSLPCFLESLARERLIVSSEATADFMLRELTDNYLSPFKIKSVMSAGIYYEGDCIGAICCESISQSRTWWPEDKNYITTIADYIALLCEQWERQAVQDQLVIAKENAEKANKAKSEFLSRISHELRTPLNAIIGFSQLIDVNPESLSETQKDSIREILNAGRHLLSLINEMLDLSAIEAGKVKITREPINISDLVNECLLLISPLTKNKSISIINNIPIDSNALLYSDYNKTKQVLINLLSNAIKYNINNGKIVIKMESKDDLISLIIEDTGFGISEDKMKTLFQAFNRSGAEYHHVEGTGIGLAISKKLIELMNGHISCSSMVGVGSKFWINLPRFKPA